MPRNPRPDGHANTTVPDGVRRAAADLCLAARQLQHWMGDPAYKPRMLTDPTRKDLADVRDRITALLGDRAELAGEIADAIEAEALRMRGEDFRSGKVGIEYINGFEDAARVARARLSEPSAARKPPAVGADTTAPSTPAQEAP